MKKRLNLLIVRCVGLRTTSLAVLTILSLILLTVCGASAQDLRQRIAAVPNSYTNTYDAVALFDSTTVRMEESGLSHVYNHQMIMVLTPAGGRDYNTVKMDYDPLSAYVEIQWVRVHRKRGGTDTLTGPVMDYPAPAHMIYWGARQKMVTLGRLEPGDVVEFQTYKKGFTYALLQNGEDDEKYIPPMRGHFYDIVPFWSSIPKIEKVYQVDVLTSKKLQYKIYHGNLEVSKTTEANRTLHTFVQRDYVPLRVPAHTLAHNDIETKLLLSTAQNWEAKSMWFYGVNEDYGSFVPTEEVKQFVRTLLRKAKSENDTISILTHWVADNMRYSGLSMGEGEGFTLHRCEMNFADRCGVCKDKAGMLITLLRAAGFKAYAAMTMAGERIDDIPADQFNHCVTVVQRRNGNYQLLDPTWVPNLRELWSSAEQQQHYLMGLPNGATLGITPVSKPEKHYLRITAKTRLTVSGHLKGSVTITAEGQSDKRVRSIFNGNPAHWRANAERQFLACFPNATLKSVRYTNNFDFLKKPVKITYTFDIPDYAIVSDNEVVVAPLVTRGLFAFAMPHLRYSTEPETRDYPFSDQCSRLVQFSETMSVPTTYPKMLLPCAKQFSEEHIAFDGGYKLSAGKILFHENVRLGKRIYEASEWPAYRNAILNQKYYENTPIILSK